jgi:RNase H-like domain found in reverse transcriptase/Reverse transcriptase (RNA-dependent DNA polymerase)/Integrase zinc binding domain
MSPAELTELKTQLTSYLDRGWIRTSTSEYASPVLFARKATGELRMCVDYRGLNKITRSNKYPLPLIDTLLDTLVGAKVFTALDLQAGYHQIRVQEEDIPKTAFKTQFGLYEFTVMPFGLSAAPSTFQRIMNDKFKDYIHDFVLIYLDDICIFSKTKEEHLIHLDKVLACLHDNQFHLRVDKCKWAVTELEYLGHVVSDGHVRPSPKKIAAVRNWPAPTTLTELRSFLGFCNYYRKHIRQFSRVAGPLYNLTKGNVPYDWTPACQLAFLTLKTMMTQAPVLMLPTTGTDAEFVVSTDASGFALGAVLLQRDKSGDLKPCAYMAKTLNTAQRQYPVYDQELLGIVCALTEWRHYLEGCASFQVITDHATLAHLPTQTQLGRRYAGWAQIISPFLTNMTILYRKGECNDSDALSRRPDLKHKLDSLNQAAVNKYMTQVAKSWRKQDKVDSTQDPEISDPCNIPQPVHLTLDDVDHVVLPQFALHSNPTLESEFTRYDSQEIEKELANTVDFLNAITEVTFDQSVSDSILRAYTSDPACAHGRTPRGAHWHDDGFLKVGHFLYVPNDQALRTRIIHECHDSPSSGHPGAVRTLALVSRTYFWPRMR